MKCSVCVPQLVKINNSTTLNMGDNFGIHRGPPTRPNTVAAAAGAASTDDRTQGQVLSNFLLQLEDYTPTVRIHFPSIITIITIKEN